MNPLVGIIMGSESDLEIMKGAAEMLRQFEVEPELTIVSVNWFRLGNESELIQIS